MEQIPTREANWFCS